MNAARKLARHAVLHRALRKAPDTRTPAETKAVTDAARRLTESMEQEYR